MSRFIAIVTVMLVLVAPSVFAQDWSTRERVTTASQKTQIESTSRQKVEALFNRLCPGRCEIVSIDVQMAKPKVVGDVAPGFEAVDGPSFDVAPENVTITVLLDSNLPANFRRNIPRMLKYRLEGLAPNVNIRAEQLAFPEPQLEPLPPAIPEPVRTRDPLPEPAPMPELAAEPVAEPAAAEAKPVEDPWYKELLPWVGPLVMTLILFAMVLVLLNRLRGMIPTTSPGSESEGRGKVAADVDGLREDFAASRVVRNRVMRDWILADVEGVARLVQLLGPEIVSDLKKDGSLSTRLERVGLLVRELGAASDEDIQKLVTNAHNRIVSTRVTLDEQGVTREWEFLEGLNVSQLKRVLGGCSNVERTHVMGLLRPALRSSYLETINEDERRALILGGSAEVLAKQAALDLAARLRRGAEELAHLGREADGQAALVAEMVDVLPLADQEQMLRELKSSRPDVADAVLSAVCMETTLLFMPDDVVADVVHRVDIETLTGFLRGARGDVRDRLLAVAPSSKRQALMTELSLELPIGKDEFLQSRRAVTSSAREVMGREGHDLSRANARALMRTNINAVDANEAMS